MLRSYPVFTLSVQRECGHDSEDWGEPMLNGQLFLATSTSPSSRQQTDGKSETDTNTNTNTNTVGIVHGVGWGRSKFQNFAVYEL